MNLSQICQCRMGSVICLSQDLKRGSGGMLLLQISALLSASQFFSSSLRWEISAFFMSHSRMPRIAWKHTASTICHRSVLSACFGWTHPCIQSAYTRPRLMPHTHEHKHTLSDYWKAGILLILKDPLSAARSSLSISARSRCVSSTEEEKEESHLFHFCPRFSAVSTTTVAENILL